MSVPMKTHRTENHVQILFEGRRRRLFVVPKEKASSIAALLSDYEAEESIPAEEVFKDLHARYGKVGTVIRGFRVRDGLTQVDLAEKIGIRQAELSQIENGKRTVGKALAKRFAAIFKTDYRTFL